MLLSGTSSLRGSVVKGADMGSQPVGILTKNKSVEYGLCRAHLIPQLWGLK